MAKLAQKLEAPVEERLAVLETRVEHIQGDVTELKASVHRLDQKIDGVKDKVDSVKDSLTNALSDFRLATEKSFRKLTVWALTLYIALATGLLAVMAKGFGWIK